MVVRKRRKVFDEVVVRKRRNNQLKRRPIFFLYILLYRKTQTADTENRTQVSDLQDQCNDHYTIPAFFL